MDLKTLLETLDKGAEVVEGLANAAGSFGGLPTAVQGAVSIAGVLANIAQNVLDRTHDNTIAVTGASQEELRARLTRLQAINDGLEAQIRNA